MGRWGQEEVVSNECVATFVSRLYLPEALHADLKVSHGAVNFHRRSFRASFLSTFAREHSSLLRDYVKSVVRALAWLIHHPADALAGLN